MGNGLPIDRRLIPPGSRVLCAVSGGADSVCMLRVLLDLGDVTCACAHFDHGLRPESGEDAAFVAGLCARWGVELITERGDTALYAEENRLSTETAARELRYAFLRRAADRWGADLIATAHNKNDNAETVLFHMARGTGLRGLTGIPERRDRIVRPLLHISRGEILAYLAERGIPHTEDATNALDDCARNYARHHVLPAMERLHPGALDSIDRMTVTLAEDEAYLTSLAEDWLSGQRDGELSASALAAMPVPVAARALRLWLGEDLSRERIGALLSLCSAGPSAVLDLPGRRVYRRYDALTLIPPRGEPLPERELRPGEELLLPEAGLAVSCRECPPGREIQTSFNTFFFSCASICGKLTITRRAEGDRVTLLGRTGRRSVKKLLMEQRIPREMRDSVPVVRDEAGVLAVYGAGQSERAFPGAGEPCYEVTFRKLTEEERE